MNRYDRPALDLEQRIRDAVLRPGERLHSVRGACESQRRSPAPCSHPAPGDVIALESPTFYAGLQTIQSVHSVRVINTRFCNYLSDMKTTRIRHGFRSALRTFG